MSPLKQSALTVLSVVAVAAAFFFVRWIVSAGVYTGFDPVSPGVCRVLASLPGPQDFEVDSAHNAIFVSSTDRHAAHPVARDGIYLLKLDDPAAAPVKLAGTPADFHPHGISLFRGPDGSEALFVLNQRTDGGQAIEIFSVSFEGGNARLTAQSSIGSGLLVSPHDIVAINPGQFYITNDHVTKNALGRFAEDDLLWPHADLLYFNGMRFRIAVQQLEMPSGVFVSPDGSHLYIATASDHRVIAFSRDIAGNLAEIGSLNLPARLDSISMDADGDLVIAGHPSLLKDHAFQADASKPSPSAVFKVKVSRDGVPQSYETIYANDGDQIGASSAAAIVGKRLLIGSALDKKLLACDMK